MSCQLFHTVWDIPTDLQLPQWQDVGVLWLPYHIWPFLHISQVPWGTSNCTRCLSNWIVLCMSQKLGWNLSHIVPCKVWLGIVAFLTIGINSSQPRLERTPHQGRGLWGERNNILELCSDGCPTLGHQFPCQKNSCLCTSVGAVWTVGFSLPEDVGQVFYLCLMMRPECVWLPGKVMMFFQHCNTSIVDKIQENERREGSTWFGEH